MIANNIMERAKDEIDFLFEATRVAHTNDEAETERMRVTKQWTAVDTETRDPSDEDLFTAVLQLEVSEREAAAPR